jgi:CRISPR type IV-associated protein Csf1
MHFASLSSSLVFARALNLAPRGMPSAHDSACAMCGLVITKGELAAPFKVGHLFTDDLSISCRGAHLMCGYCVALMDKEILQRNSAGGYGADGVKPFRKWGDIAACLMSPPEPPFVMFYATSKSQHMAWRSPINFSKKAFWVRVGLRDLLIRKAVLLQATHACKALTELLYPDGYRTDLKTNPHPYLSLSSDIKDINHGRINPKIGPLILTASATQDQRRALILLRNLSLGESWALRFILTPQMARNCPEAIGDVV